MSQPPNDTDRIPLPAALPASDIMVEIFQRITLLSDEINDPNGLLSTRLRGIEEKATARHVQQMALMNRVLDEVLSVKARLDIAEDTLETHGSRLQLLNGHDSDPAIEVQ